MAKPKGFKKVPVGVYEAKIVDTELRWSDLAPRLTLYLAINEPIIGAKGQTVPFDDSHGAGGFKNEVKSLRRFKMSHPDLVKIRHDESNYVHPFILNNVLYGFGFTNQWKYYHNFISFIRDNLKLDARTIDESNVELWDDLIRACLTGQTFESSWAQWFYPNKRPFVGPDGDLMLVKEAA